MNGRCRGLTLAGLAILAPSAAVLLRRRWARYLAGSNRGSEPFVTAPDGVHLHVETRGRPDAGLTVVLVHGIGVTAGEFRHQQDALGPHARVVLFDQRGHGRSGWGDHRHSTVDELGRDLERLLAETTEGPVVLVGHSMGGMSIIALASQRPDLFGTRVVGVGLLSTSAGELASAALPRWAAQATLRTGLARAALWWLWLIAPLTDPLHPLMRRLGRRWLHRKLFGRGVPRPDTERVVDQMWRDASLAMVTGFLPSLAYHGKTPALQALRGVPTLVLAGIEDATIPCRHSARIVQQVGDSARLVLVRDAGHLVNMTHPDVVNSSLLELLARVRDRA